MSEYMQNCRSCFGKKDVNISIFSNIKIEGKRLKVKELLLQYTQLEILHKDLPTKICTQCLEHLKDAHVFSERCLETEKLLQHTITQSVDLSPPVGRLSLARKSKKKNIISDNYLSTKSPREIKILPKRNASNAIMLNATSSDSPLSNPVIVLQNTESKPIKNFGYELGLTRRGVYACTLCSRKFVSAKYLNAHTESVHSEIQLTAKCHACDVELETKEDLLKHNMVMHFTTRHDTGMKRTCQICSKRFRNDTYLAKHMSKMHSIVADESEVKSDGVKDDNGTKLTCKICSKRFRNVSYLAKHMSKMHSIVADESEVKSDCVKDEFDETVQRSSDEDVNTSRFPIECKLCGKTFGFYKNYRIHKAIHERNVCLRCNKCFPNKESMLAHLSSHTEANPFVCAYCNKVYMTRTALLAHYKSSYNIRDKVYFCGLCETIAEAHLCHESLLEHLKQHETSERNLDEAETVGAAQQEVLDDGITATNDEFAAKEDEFAATEDEFAGTEVEVAATEDEFAGTEVEVAATENGVAATDLTDTVHYIVVKDGDCDVDKYVQISAEQVDMLISGELTESDLIQATKLLDSNEPKLDTDQIDTTQQDTDPTLQQQDVADSVTEDIPDSMVFETHEIETHEIETEEVETLMSDTSASGTIEPGSNVAKADFAETQLSPSTSEEHKCSVCGDVLTRRFNLWRHQAMAHKMYTMRCAYCPQKFNNMKLYDVHRFNCALTKGSPKGNWRDSNKLERYGGVTCPICKEKFPRRAYMFKHLSEKHSEEARADIETRDYHCRICDKKMTTATGFGCHMKAHYGFPRHTCNVCSRRFTSAVALRNHVTCRHTNHRPHLCTLCGRRFVSKDHLRKHIKLTHRRQRDFLCGVCGLTFLQSSHVTQHMWTHTGIKPHQCKYCQRRFTSNTGLKKHINRTHIDEYETEQAKKEAHYKKLELAEQSRISRSLVPDELIYGDILK